MRITDLAAGLSTNRSYLSAFINKEYGMNFCRLINRCRLMALDRLRVSPAMQARLIWNWYLWQASVVTGIIFG
ncbi:MAG: hypothetical protein V8T33_07025 [Parabacteroides distasonis]